jgi:alkylation response protein AidB-like acyl-CoA dehydrogenase
MNFKFDGLQSSIQKLAREVAQKELGGRIEEFEETQSIPLEVFKKIADAGILGIPFPEEFGGSDAGYIAKAIAIEEIAKVYAGAAASVAVAITCLEGIKYYGSEEQKKKYIPAGINGEFRGSLAFTEPGTGSDPKQVTTTAKKEGDYYILNGVKRFITNSSYAGPILLFARDLEVNNISAFLFDKLGPGYSVSTPWPAVGMRGSAIYDVFLDKVKIPASALVGKPGEGFNILLGTIAHSKVSFCAAFVGTMAASYAAAVRYAKEKMHRDKPIAKFQAVQLKIAQIAANLESARLLTYKLAEITEDRSNMERLKAWVGMVKSFVTDLAVPTNLLCMNIMGAYGVTAEYNVERYLRDSLIGPHIEGVSDVQRVIAANYILNTNDPLV